MHVTVDGTLKPDGTLELDAKPPVVPGRVRVTIEHVPAQCGQVDALQALEEIFAEQDQAGEVSRSAAEIDSQIQQLRNEWDERQRELERIRHECQHGRQQDT